MPAPLDHRSPAFFDYAVQADGVVYKFRIADYRPFVDRESVTGTPRKIANSGR
jgi:hypothetical protein